MDKKRLLIDKECREWGIGLIIAGVIAFLFPYFLDIFVGFIALILGIVTLIFRRNWTLAVIGGVIIIIGSLNILGSILVGQTGWAIVGFIQIVIGIGALNKYNSFKNG